MKSAKAYATAKGRQQYEGEPGGRPAKLAPCSRQRLMPPLSGANNMRRSPEAAGRVGAMQAAKTYAIA